MRTSVACAWGATTAHQDSSARDAETRLVANEGDAPVKLRRLPGSGSDPVPILLKRMPEPGQAKTKAEPAPLPCSRQNADGHRAKGLGDRPECHAAALSAGVSTR